MSQSRYQSFLSLSCLPQYKEKDDVFTRFSDFPPFPPLVVVGSAGGHPEMAAAELKRGVATTRQSYERVT